MRHGRIYLRGRVWWCWFYDSSGKAQYQSTRCTDKGAALAFLREREREAADPALEAARAETLADALARVVTSRGPSRSESTVEQWAQKGLQLCREIGGKTPLAQITASRVDEYVASRRAKLKRDGSRAISESSIHKELCMLRLALKYAARAGRWTGEASTVVPPISVPAAKRHDRWLTLAEVQQLLAVWTDDRAARVAYSVATGAEWSALDRAERGDVTPDLRFVHVRGTKRSHRDAVVPIVLPEQRELLKWALDRAQGTERLFLPWCSQSNAVRDLKAACRRAGVREVSWHDLRRTCSQWLAQAGADVVSVAGVLRNSPAVAATVYARLDPVSLLAKLSADCSNSVVEGSISGGLGGVGGVPPDGQNALKEGVSGGPCRDRTDDQRIKSPNLLLTTRGKTQVRKRSRKKTVVDM